MAQSKPTECPVAHTLRFVGEHGTLLLLRDLFLHGPRRFQDFRSSLPAYSPNTLSARLKQLEKDGLVQRVAYCDHPQRLHYVLTPKGQSLGPVVRAMRDWGMKNASAHT